MGEEAKRQMEEKEEMRCTVVAWLRRPREEAERKAESREKGTHLEIINVGNHRKS